ncbi:hypothetical protein [Ralstonia pickettii]|nr:hypothetical protein [Ralstonia pickettii]MBB0022957.1 hypothetical protein [Ralstonia pickettii]MBB0033514.1 hypothetical protein [Ralstonia pickettii]MBB0095957.1 hypothetical protein [Ralstonia pickettii]MBB0105982.1 hypothetical protein [Ralstonia pickettii]MBB0127626.1 hypothetical protein [Ralstonia pickettii]
METMEAVEDPEGTVEAPGSGPDDLADDSTDGTLCSCVAECWVLGEEETGEVGMPEVWCVRGFHIHERSQERSVTEAAYHAR